MYQRALDEKIVKDFQEGGVLHDLLDYVQSDDTLDLEFRGEGRANIYYRGGSLFRIDRSVGGYMLTFDTKYCTACDEGMEKTPLVRAAVGLIPLYKHAMDVWFAKNRKYEREFQQVVVRENNRHGEISHASDYYITDVEYVSDEKSAKNARFDMVAVKWLSTASARKNESAPTLSVIEMKYGDDAYDGGAGLEKHLSDFDAFVRGAEMDAFCADMAKVFRQKCELGLIPDMAEKKHDILISKEDMELIFLIANHDPDKTKLGTVVDRIAELAREREYPFTIKFATASMMGYCLYADQMKSLEEMQEFLNKKA